MTLTEITTLIGTAISAGTLVGLLIALKQIRINRKQLSLSTINYCLNKFGTLDLRQESSEAIVRAYIDLVNEELFFFQYEYLPKEIAYEWLDGMLDYMPLLSSDGDVLNSDVFLLYLTKAHESLLKNYPRITHTFTIHHLFDTAQVYDGSQEGKHIRQQARENLIKG